MVIDIHTHTFPEKIAAKTIQYLKDKAGIKCYGDGKISGLERSMEVAGVDISVLMPVVTKPAQCQTINRVAAETTEQYAGRARRLISFGGIHPDTPDYKDELKRIRDLGLPGIKIHPAYQRVDIDDIRYKRIIDYAGGLGLWTDVHAGIDPGFPGEDHCSVERLARLLTDVPGDRLILAHMGGVTDEDKTEELLCTRDVWFDTAISVTYLPEERFIRLVRARGSERVIYGTDWPWDDQKNSKNRLLSMALTQEEKDNILWRNGAAVLGLAL